MKLLFVTEEFIRVFFVVGKSVFKREHTSIENQVYRKRDEHVDRYRRSKWKGKNNNKDKQQLIKTTLVVDDF
jgi:hypothetical protein